jgi:hypothetical protein
MDINNLSSRELVNLIRNPNTSPDVLDSIAHMYTNESFLWWISLNPNTSVKTLAYLSTLDSVQVRCSVASNTNTPPSILTKFAASDYPDIVLAVANNVNTPVAAFDYIVTSKHYHWPPLMAVAENPSVSLGILRRLASHPDDTGNVRMAVASNPKSTIEILVKIVDFERNNRDKLVPKVLKVCYNNKKCPAYLKALIKTLLEK